LGLENPTLDLHSWNLSFYWGLSMGKVLCALAMFFIMSTLSIASPDTEVDDKDSETNEFWPPDMVPHPHPPHQPRKDDGWAEKD
jgi:hypothetical protein